ncbi:MAG: hypothetical protein JXB39_14740 [Deltaproteobacteria bacterium]|nr:hypothetical protein [Deltaproteobacteria bacterium]
MSPLLLALLLPVARAACEDVSVLVKDLEQATLEGRTEAVQEALGALRVAFGCGPQADPTLLGRMWLAEGVHAARTGDPRFASIAFASAARVAPDVWNDAYGPEVRSMYDAAVAKRPGEGQVRVSPVPEGYVTALDGTQVSFPTRTLEGLHVVQVGPSGNRAVYASVFYLPPGETFFVLTELGDARPSVAEAPTPAQIPAAPVAPVPARRPARAWLVSGGVAAALAAGSALLAVHQDAAMEEATRMDDLDAAFQRQKAWAWTSYGCMGLSAVSVGLFFAL